MTADTSAGRRAFLAERRAIGAQRMDELFASRYDERWGHINATHRRFVADLLGLTPAGATLLDAGCGTGKYVPMILAAGRSLVGVDRSAGMLGELVRKYPHVPVRKLSLENLARARDMAGRFDGALCVDAVENVPPEDWPVVLAGLAHALKAGAPLYLTVEVPDAEDREAAAHPPAPLVTGEVLWPDDRGGAYHYFPDPQRVPNWLAAAGFVPVTEASGDGYHHYLGLLS